jgi:hypothetical protein
MRISDDYLREAMPKLFGTRLIHLPGTFRFPVGYSLGLVNGRLDHPHGFLADFLCPGLDDAGFILDASGAGREHGRNHQK